MILYHIAILGAPTPEQLHALDRYLEHCAGVFRLRIPEDIKVSSPDDDLIIDRNISNAAIFFGGPSTAAVDLKSKLDITEIPVLPVATRTGRVEAEIPESLRELNCSFYEDHGPDRVFSALLQCLGLLPKQRRVFLSYRRVESTPAALQLFAELSARNFDVFLDTHSIGAGANFQENLWHRLCDVDVMLMLDTPGYFKSRWTEEEFGRALAKGIGILRVSWPEVKLSRALHTSAAVGLAPGDLSETGDLAQTAVNRICAQLERFRSQAHAVRHLHLVTAIEDAVELAGGSVESVGANRAMQVLLPLGRHVIVHPVVGVPTAVTLQEAITAANKHDAAVVYDHLGIMPSWLDHLDWLGRRIDGARWIRASDAASTFSGWGTV